MSKLSSIPRLSIVVPVGDDTAAFEETLLSVLENRPLGCEILVAHDGRYQDPFELADEVRFITHPTASLIELIAKSADQARGRFVHILASGLAATQDWTDTALAQFECQQTAVVAPVISSDHRVVAAGWGDTPQRLFQPIAAGHKGVERAAASGVLGAYLQASFWRRDILRSLLAAFDSTDVHEANYAYGRLLIASGWRCSLAAGCEVLMRSGTELTSRSSYLRGQRLWAIKKSIDPSTRRVTWAKMLRAILRPAVAAETLGQIQGLSAVPAINRRLQGDKLPACGAPAVMKMPRENSVNQTRSRRAA